ncbi:NAD(P)-dependent oxidoreductase [Corynebacterium halotolerans]|uniref:NAD(P)-dependent oxidoreductase n=1 Tax=Corynebacterium halotolerans TaxID=225326 RepID=UPI003CF62D7E
MVDTKSKKVLIIGGHGRTALIATPKLIKAGHDVTSVIRNPNHVSDIEAIGATPLIRDIVGLEVETWEKRLKDFDVVIWAATAGDVAGAGETYALDRDSALTSLQAMQNLKDRGEHVPRYLMLSFLGSLTHETDPEDSFYPYAESKKEVDRELLATSDLEVLILAPGALTMEENTSGGRVIDGDTGQLWDSYTSRYLVADLITEMTGRDSLPEQKLLSFTDGQAPVSEL